MSLRPRQAQADNLNYTRARSPPNIEHAVRNTSSRGSSSNPRPRTRRLTGGLPVSSDRSDEVLSNAAEAPTIRDVSPACSDDDAMDTSTSENVGQVLVSDLRLNERPQVLVQHAAPEYTNASIANNINYEFISFLNDHPMFTDRSHPQRKARVFACSPVSIANGDHSDQNLPVLTPERMRQTQEYTRGYHYYV